MDLSREECDSAVRSVVGDDADCVLLNYTVFPASESPIGFMGTHLRVEASVLLNGSEKIIKFFAKKPPLTGVHKSYVETCRLFHKEAKVYTSYAPIMRSLLPDGIKLPMPECFLSGGGKDNDLILLEDLREKGYRMADKWKTMDMEQCKIVLNAQARLHGASVLLMLTEGDPKPLYRKGEFESFEETIFMYDLSHPSCLWCKSSAETVATAVSRLWPERFGSESKEREVFEHAWGAWKEVFEILPPSKRYANVLCHGDSWANNIMFLYKKSGENELPVDAVLVDYQMIRFAPPAFDVVFFLHTNTRRRFRDDHFDELLKYYWECFREVVGPKISEKWLPLKELRASAEEMRVFGRIFSTSLLSTVLISDEGKEESTDKAKEEEEEKDFIESMVQNRGNVVISNANKDPQFKERIAEVYQDFLESVGLWDKQ